MGLICGLSSFDSFDASLSRMDPTMIGEGRPVYDKELGPVDSRGHRLASVVAVLILHTHDAPSSKMKMTLKGECVGAMRVLAISPYPAVVEVYFVCLLQTD